MSGKKVEGSEEQKRARAREARDADEDPSAAGVTSGASKQRTHVRHSEDTEEKQEARARGKQPEEHDAPAAARPSARRHPS